MKLFSQHGMQAWIYEYRYSSDFMIEKKEFVSLTGKVFVSMVMNIIRGMMQWRDY